MHRPKRMPRGRHSEHDPTSWSVHWEEAVCDVCSCDLIDDAAANRQRQLCVVTRGAAAVCVETKIAQGWPKLWANLKALIGVFSDEKLGQILQFGPTL